MKDRDFLVWVHQRLVSIHGENPHSDFMYKLRAIIQATPADRETMNVVPTNNIDELLKLIGVPEMYEG